MINNKLYSIILDVFCCDALAKSFVLKIKGHNSFFLVHGVRLKENTEKIECVFLTVNQIRDLKQDLIPVT